jgi:hypothetical protein
VVAELAQKNRNQSQRGRTGKCHGQSVNFLFFFFSFLSLFGTTLFVSVCQMEIIESESTSPLAQCNGGASCFVFLTSFGEFTTLLPLC